MKMLIRDFLDIKGIKQLIRQQTSWTKHFRQMQKNIEDVKEEEEEKRDKKAAVEQKQNL